MVRSMQVVRLDFDTPSESAFASPGVPAEGDEWKLRVLNVRFIAFLILAMLVPLSPTRAAAPLDTLIFGSPASEKSHALVAVNSETITGGLGEPARRLLPQSIETWEGGSVSFTLKVDPVLPTYITGRFWGDDTSPDLLILRCEGKQIGYRHLGDIDVLDFGSDSGSPALNGRFFYTTSPLPLEMTRGKRELHFEIHSTGRIWGYGTTFEQYQKPMKDPTRGLYRMYTHTRGCFIPPADEKQGIGPADPPVRSEPGSGCSTGSKHASTTKRRICSTTKNRSARCR